jgi:flagellar biosynthesis protein FliR
MSLLSTLQEISNSLGFHVDIQTGALLFGLVWARILASLSLIPFLGGPSVSGQIKVGLSALIAMLLLPGPDRKCARPRLCAGLLCPSC